MVLLFQPLFLSSVVKTWADGYRGDRNWGEFRTWVRSGEVGFHGGRHLKSIVTQSRKGMHQTCIEFSGAWQAEQSFLKLSRALHDERAV